MDRNKRILEYFRVPNHDNLPEVYFAESERSEFLVRVIKRLFPCRETRIMELGTGPCRNLYYLNHAGYNHLSGIEQSQTYIDYVRHEHPNLLNQVLLYIGTVEDILPRMNRFNLIFTMAVLEHIPDGPIFDVIPKRSNFLLTIEDEVCDTWNHFPRNYKDVFESRGSKHIKAWKFPPLEPAFVMRLFDNRSVE